jgi:hypothetical protein
MYILISESSFLSIRFFYAKASYVQHMYIYKTINDHKTQGLEFNNELIYVVNVYIYTVMGLVFRLMYILGPAWLQYYYSLIFFFFSF